MKISKTAHHPETLSPAEFDAFLAKGWYRMTQHIFTVTHLLNSETFDVDRVWWLRFHKDAIRIHRSHQKIRKRNAGFEVRYDKYDTVSGQDEQLYDKYYQWISFNGYPTLDYCLYGEEANKQLFNTWAISVLDKDQLIAKGIIDLGEKAIMAKVSFFDPAYSGYSPGKFLMLKSIDFMRERGYNWYYPGYIIVNRPKFDYKLFLGKEAAQYYDPESEHWKPYDDTIMIPEIRSEEEENLLRNVYFSFWR